jgi:hypothetical protein
VRHPECLHPVANASDDYSGVVCCCCDSRPCDDVTPAHHRDHQLWDLEMWAEAGRV